jgi:small subunit ribosomal protein S6
MPHEGLDEAVFAPAGDSLAASLARRMPLYDLMLLLDPGAPSDRHQAILGDVQKLLEADGKLVGAHEWGTRRMTFEIDHRPDAAYHLFQFETAEGGALLERVDHSLKIMDGVLRHRIIRLKDGSPPPPMPRQEGRPYGDAEGMPDAAAPVDAGEAADPTQATDAAAPGDPTSVTAAVPSDAPETQAETPAADAAPAETAAADDAPAEAAAEPVETAAPDASSLPAEDQAQAGDGDEPSGTSAA